MLTNLKKYYFVLPLLLILLLFTWNLYSQENYLYENKFEAYTDYVSKKFGIISDIPEKFINLDKYYVGWKVRNNDAMHTGSMYGPTFISDDKECILMYPALLSQISKDDLFRWGGKYPREGQITDEIKTALGLYYSYKSSLNSDSRFDFNDYVTIVAGKKAREMFNADSIYIFDIPGGDSVFIFDETLEKMRKSKYPYCTSLFISKKNRGAIDIKLFFTKEGKKREDEYINMLSKCVWYDDNFKHE